LWAGKQVNPTEHSVEHLVAIVKLPQDRGRTRSRSQRFGRKRNIPKGNKESRETVEEQATTIAELTDFRKLAD
jgi:hypothetical protein